MPKNVQLNGDMTIANPNGSFYIGETDSLRFGYAPGTAEIIQASVSNCAIGTQSEHVLTLGTFNTPRITIQTDGNVGIGNTTPGHLLDVSGNVNATNYLVNSNVGFTGNGVFTTFTIENGIITAAS